MNAQELVDRVVRDARIPQGHSFRATATLLGMADEEMETLVVPEVLKVAGRYLGATALLPLVQGKSRYRLPARCLRGEHVQKLMADGKVDPTFSAAQLTDTDRLKGTTAPPRLWYFDADCVVVLPTPAASGGWLRITYARRPGQLVLPTAAVQVSDSSFVGSSQEQVLTGAPPAALQDPVPVNVISASGAFSALFSGAPDDVSETDPGVTWRFDLPALQALDVAAGDWVAADGYSPVPQVPLAYHTVLVQAVVARVFKELRRENDYQSALATLEILKQGARDTVAPRTRDSRVVVQRDW
jgi:hypothetical protein